MRVKTGLAQIYKLTALLLMSVTPATLTGQQHPPNVRRSSSPSVQPAPAAATNAITGMKPALGTITGFVYWQMNVFQPSSSCQGLTLKVVTVNKVGMPLQLLSTSTSLTAAGPMTDTSSPGTPKYMLCSYAFQSMPENVALRVLLYGAPAWASVALPSSFQISGDNCNSTPSGTLSFILSGGEMICGNGAFNINFKLSSVPRRPTAPSILQPSSAPGGMLSGTPQSGMLSGAPPSGGSSQPSSGTLIRLQPNPTNNAVAQRSSSNASPNSQLVSKNPALGVSGSNKGEINPAPTSHNRGLDPALSQKIGPAKVRAVVKSPLAGHVDAAIIVVLRTQRNTAETEAAQMKLSLHSSPPVVSGGPSQIMSATGVAATPGQGNAGGNTPMSPQPATGINSTAKFPSAIAHVPHVNTTAIVCSNDPTFRILTVSGTAGSATFTPIQQYNLYTIVGCSFGKISGGAYIYGAGSFRADFVIKFWSDNLITVALDPNLSGFPDLQNIVLVVQRQDQQQAQKSGFNFYASRQKLPLSTIPSSWVKLVTYTNNGKTLDPQYSSPPSDFPGPGPSAGSAYVRRFYDGEKFFPKTQPTLQEDETPVGNKTPVANKTSSPQVVWADYYDLTQLAPGWTTDSFQVTTYPQNCPYTVTYKQDFGAWSWDWDLNNPDNIVVWPSTTTCSGVFPPMPFQNYQNWTGSYYALRVWVVGPRGLDPFTNQPTSP